MVSEVPNYNGDCLDWALGHVNVPLISKIRENLECEVAKKTKLKRFRCLINRFP